MLSGRINRINNLSTPSGKDRWNATPMSYVYWVESWRYVTNRELLLWRHLLLPNLTTGTNVTNEIHLRNLKFSSADQVKMDPQIWCYFLDGKQTRLPG